MGEVINIKSIPSKSSTLKYRGFVVTITYVVSSQEWEWEFTQTVNIVHRDRASTLDRASKAAQKHIDKLL